MFQKMFQDASSFLLDVDLILVTSCWKSNFWILSKTVEPAELNVFLTSVSSCKFVFFVHPVFVAHKSYISELFQNAPGEHLFQ